MHQSFTLYNSAIDHPMIIPDKESGNVLSLNALNQILRLFKLKN